MTPTSNFAFFEWSVLFRFLSSNSVHDFTQLSIFISVKRMVPLLLSCQYLAQYNEWFPLFFRCQYLAQYNEWFLILLSCHYLAQYNEWFLILRSCQYLAQNNEWFLIFSAANI